jgi:hypothetical protein
VGENGASHAATVNTADPKIRAKSLSLRDLMDFGPHKKRAAETHAIKATLTPD